VISTRDRLVTAAKELLWERGYGAMSPGEVLKASGAGQGSLYHHFSGKADLAATAVRAVEAEMRAEADAVLRADKPPLERVRDYLMKPRASLRGCRLGRLVHDADVVAHGALREPIAASFAYVERALADALTEAQREGALTGDLDAADLAASIVAVVQGGYVLARASRDPTQMDRATRGAVALLDMALARLIVTGLGEEGRVCELSVWRGMVA